MATTKHEKKRDLTAQGLYEVNRGAYERRLLDALHSGTPLPEHGRDDPPGARSDSRFWECSCGRLWEVVTDYGGGVVLYYSGEFGVWSEPGNQEQELCMAGDD